MTDFATVLRQHGLEPREIAPDGRWRRCRTADKPKHKNGAYRLMPDGTGMWRNWATDVATNIWHSGEEQRPMSPEIQRRIDARLQRLREQERARRDRGMAWSNKIWAEALPCRRHAYLDGKGLSAVGRGHLRVWRGAVHIDADKPPLQDDWLLAPLYFGDRLVNVQRISSGGIKRQVSGAPQRACWLTLERKGAAITVVAEGLATGLAVFQSVPTCRVVVAFFADNLAAVADKLRPTGNVVFAADNDHGTAARGKGNPGIEKARNAAELIGAGVAWPEGIGGTDWCDALHEWGERGHKRIQALIQGQSRYVPMRR